MEIKFDQMPIKKSGFLFSPFWLLRMVREFQWCGITVRIENVFVKDYFVGFKLEI